MEDRELGLAPDDVTGQHALPAFGGCQDSKDGGARTLQTVVAQSHPAAFGGRHAIVRTVKCPSCGTANPDDARFCNACGSRLDASPQPEPAIDPFLPKELLTKLEAARAGRAMEGERRVVTMLFCDVKGSTAMAETLDAEDWAEIMNGAFERLIAPVYRYEGTLARLMGDAIFAFFGAPIAHEDDPQRAVWAGLDIVSGIAGYKQRVRAERGLDLDVRVGINTGPVMVGQVGSDLRLEYTAMGDAVNVAARMEQTAEPGTVQITAETHRLVEPLFDLEARGGIEVKGKAEPVEAYRVLGRRAEPGPIRGMRGSPLVGRDREMEQLRGAVEEAQSGGGRIVSLVGEAGLGKSRLINETRAEWTRRPARRCVPRPTALPRRRRAAAPSRDRARPAVSRASRGSAPARPCDPGPGTPRRVQPSP